MVYSSDIKVNKEGRKLIAIIVYGLYVTMSIEATSTTQPNESRASRPVNFKSKLAVDELLRTPKWCSRFDVRRSHPTSLGGALAIPRHLLCTTFDV